MGVHCAIPGNSLTAAATAQQIVYLPSASQRAGEAAIPLEISYMPSAYPH